MRILITGSRTWTDRQVVADALLAAWGEFRDETPARVVVVHGGARGADLIADWLARRLGWLPEEHRADWDTYGKTAGHIRNAQMVDAGADVCLAFLDLCRKPGCKINRRHYSHGTQHCASLAFHRGIPVRRYYTAEAQP